MITEIILPALGETMDDAMIVRWCKQVGDDVSKGDSLFEIETDKATIEVEALESGFLREIIVQADQRASIGTVVAYIADSFDEPIPEKPSTKTARSAGDIQDNLNLKSVDESPRKVLKLKIIASPRARRLADKVGLDITLIETGTGAKGRIVEADVKRYLESADSDPIHQAPSIQVETQISRGEDQIIPLAGPRKAIAERMSQSTRTAPHFFLTTSIDMTIAEKTRESWNLRADRSGNPGVSMTAIIAFACARTLREHRWLNATLRGDEIILLRDINIGIAVARDEGLIVPVIRNADQKGLARISDEIMELSERARAGKLRVDQAGQSTFTISNLGM